MSYDFRAIEAKWKQVWKEKDAFRCDTHDFSKPKYYVLDMFPYPSGQGLHVGHPEGYTATDIIARMKRMQGYNVLHPMGWDAFGLPAEQFAIKNNVHPEGFTRQNIAHFKQQIDDLGFSYDWSKEIATIDPGYYKWTQWIFTELLKHDLAYVDDVPVNYCPELGTVLANEEVKDGVSERGGYPVIRMPLRQWMLRITEYADRLEEDLKLLDWPSSTLDMQRNWIGKSNGAEIEFDLADGTGSFKVFTTRADTLFGCTYCCLAPEHPLVEKIVTPECAEAVKSYVDESKSKSDLSRTKGNKEKTGVFTGAYAINPINGKKVPVCVADYVLGSYGSGAVMAVPAHDSRDYDFARKHGLPIVQVVDGDISEAAYEGDGKHINSSFADGMDNESAKAAIIKKLEELGKGKRVVNYKLRDWIFSRQRYWGEPIPVAKLEDGTEFPLPLDQLPLTLPELDSYEPSKDGKPPLSRAPKEWLDYVAPDGRKGQRETNTMPQWAGSCWYYIRYIDPHNDSCIGDKELLDHWLPVDLYVGGAEHAVLHLLYARFWHKFLYDIGAVSCKEPFKKLFHQGMILGANGEKMSKSRGNVVNPDDIVKSHGADSLRLFEMFAGPLQEAKPWSTSGLDGAKRFIERVYRIVDEEGGNRLTNENDGSLDSSYAKMVKKVSEDYESLAFNTAISAMMVFINDCYKAKSIYRPYFEGFVKVFSCLCPFVGEQMWNMLGHDDLITYQSWPTYDESKLAEAKKNIAVSINGKTRDVIAMDADIDQEGALALAAASPKIKPYLEGKAPRKVIFVKGRILNIVL